MGGHVKRNILSVAFLALLVGTFASAQGMMGGSAGGGVGMVTVASDGSVLVTSMTGSMMGGGSSQSAVVDVGPNGTERWRATFTDGSPMMVASNGDLVVVVLVKRSMTGGPMMGGETQTTPGAEDADLIGLSLANGAQRFRTALPGEMASVAQFSPDGSHLYVTVLDRGTGMMSPGSMRQGGAGAFSSPMTSTLLGISRAGAILWTLDLAQSRMGM